MTAFCLWDPTAQLLLMRINADTVYLVKTQFQQIIRFLGYVLRLLNTSKEAFTIDAFVERVFDSEFVESDRYAELLVAEIPKLRLADTMIAIYRARKKAELRKLRHLVPSCLRHSALLNSRPT